MFRLLTILALVFSLFLSWSVLKGGDIEMHPLNQKDASREEEIKKYDLNEDEVLQFEERQSVIMNKFEDADSNKDGAISYDETKNTVSEFEEKGDHFGKWVDHHGQHLGKKIEAVDLDKDGMISQEEYFFYFNLHYEQMDKNKDGQITIKEYLVHTSRLNK